MKGPGKSKRLFRLSEFRRHVEEEVDDELRFHMEGLAERFRSQGRSGGDHASEVRGEKFQGYRIRRSYL